MPPFRHPSTLILTMSLSVALSCDRSDKQHTSSGSDPKASHSTPQAKAKDSKAASASSASKPTEPKKPSAGKSPASTNPAKERPKLGAKYARDVHFERYWGERPDDAKKANAESRKAVAQGRRAALKKDWSKAVQEFVHALTLNPLNGEALGELGFARQQLGDVSPYLFRAAERLVASAGHLGGDLKTRGAVVHNLAKEYVKQGETELALRAKERSRLLKTSSKKELHQTAETMGDRACPVVVRVAKEKLTISKWGEIYSGVDDANLLPEGESDDPPRQLDTNDEQAARARLCSSIGEHGMCEPGGTYDLTYPKPNSWLNMYHLVIWPLANGQAAVQEAPTPMTSCEERGGRGGRVKNFLTYLEYFHFPLGSYEELEHTSADPSCTTGGVEQRLTVHDIELQRSFHLDGGESDIYVRLEPEKHALIVYGEFCGHRYFLNKCKNGVCQPEPERMPPN